MEGNVLVAYGWCELQYGCAINNNACKNMHCKNAVVKRSIVTPMFISTNKVFVLWNQFIQKESKESEPKNGNGNFL
jgi:hypothetical protein